MEARWNPMLLVVLALASHLHYKLFRLHGQRGAADSPVPQHLADGPEHHLLGVIRLDVDLSPQPSLAVVDADADVGVDQPVAELAEHHRLRVLTAKLAQPGVGLHCNAAQVRQPLVQSKRWKYGGVAGITVPVDAARVDRAPGASVEDDRRGPQELAASGSGAHHPHVVNVYRIG